MTKKELKLNIAQTTKMFDLDNLIEDDPALFDELCDKYPLKKECVYFIKVEKEHLKRKRKETVANSTDFQQLQLDI